MEACLRTIGPSGGTALWIFPYREISRTSVRFPLDLVFLSNDNVVLNTIKSFPLSGERASCAQAITMLAFPADTLARDEIRPGDRLMIGTPEEIKHHLKHSLGAKDSVPVELSVASRENGNPNSNRQPQIATGTVRESSTGPGDNLVANASAESPQPEACCTEPAMPAEPPAKSDVAERPWAKRETSRNWFQRLMLGDTPEPRGAPRVVVPGLIVYFFTGGAPKPCEVRDISTSGLYIITSERWYIGTVILLTLSDRHNRDAERSLTVNTRVARSGDDGVGLEFLLIGDDRLETMHLGPDHQTGAVDIHRLNVFIERLRDA